MKKTKLFCHYSTKGWMWSAGYRYWRGESYDENGIGFRADTLKKHGTEIIVVVDDQKYKLNCKEALEFIRQHDSIFEAGKRKKIKLGIVSKSLMIPVFT